MTVWSVFVLAVCAVASFVSLVCIIKQNNQLKKDKTKLIEIAQRSCQLAEVAVDKNEKSKSIWSRIARKMKVS